MAKNIIFKKPPYMDGTIRKLIKIRQEMCLELLEGMGEFLPTMGTLDPNYIKIRNEALLLPNGKPSRATLDETIAVLYSGGVEVIELKDMWCVKLDDNIINFEIYGKTTTQFPKDTDQDKTYVSAAAFTADGGAVRKPACPSISNGKWYGGGEEQWFGGFIQYDDGEWEFLKGVDYKKILMEAQPSKIKLTNIDDWDKCSGKKCFEVKDTKKNKKTIITAVPNFLIVYDGKPHGETMLQDPDQKLYCRSIAEWEDELCIMCAKDANNTQAEWTEKLINQKVKYALYSDSAGGWQYTLLRKEESDKKLEIMSPAREPYPGWSNYIWV